MFELPGFRGFVTAAPGNETGRHLSSSYCLVNPGVRRGSEALLNDAAMANVAKKVLKKMGEDRRDLPGQQNVASSHDDQILGKRRQSRGQGSEQTAVKAVLLSR